VPIAYKTVHKLVRYHLHAKLKVPRKSRIKKPPEEEATFREHFADRRQHNLTEVQALSPSSAACPVRVFCQDESRFGLLPVQRRRITLSGVKPVGTVQ
jgi:hypothetical protein